METDMPNVLTAEHCQCIDTCLQSIPGTTKLIDALEKCGMDVSAARDANQDHYSKATGIKAHFFPKNP